MIFRPSIRKFLPAGFAILAALPAPAASLFLTGHFEGDKAHLDPAFIMKGPGSVPATGPYTLRILDGAGTLLHALPFDTGTVFACGRGPCREIRTHFCLDVPLTEDLQARMATVEVCRGAARLGLLRSSAWRPSETPGEAQVPAPVPPGREPRAVALGGGKVRLTWDHTTHPSIMIKDAGGEIIASATQGPVTLDTGSASLDLIMSDGLRTLDHRVAVTGVEENKGTVR